MTVTVNTFKTTDSTVNIAAAIDVVASAISANDHLLFIKTPGEKAIVALINAP